MTTYTEAERQRILDELERMIPFDPRSKPSEEKRDNVVPLRRPTKKAHKLWHGDALKVRRKTEAKINRRCAKKAGDSAMVRNGGRDQVAHYANAMGIHITDAKALVAKHHAHLEAMGQPFLSR